MADDIGFDAWRGKVVGGGDPNPFHAQIPVKEEETKVEEHIDIDEVIEESPDMGVSARKMVTDGTIPGAIFDADTMSKAIREGREIFQSKTEYSDQAGNPIYEITVLDDLEEKVVGYIVQKAEMD